MDGVNRRIIDDDFNRRSVLMNLVKEAKSIPIPTDDNNNNILPSILRYSLNKPFPYPHSEKCKKEQKKSCCKRNKYYITQKDIGIHGIIINKPGTYIFCSDIVFSPLLDHTSAIIIAASNVTLDLSKYSLIQGNTVPNVYGIVIARTFRYVTITGKKNIAVIKNFTLAGIRVYGKTQYIAIRCLIVKQDIPVQLTNEQIPVSCFDILQLSLTLGIAIGEGDTFGVHMQGTDKKNLVEELSMTDVTVDGATIGCHMIFTFGFEILRSIFTKNTYYGLLHGTGWVVPGDGPFGLTFPVGGNGVITNCRFEGNHGLNLDLANPGDTFVFDFVSAVANYEVSNVTIENCLVADNSNNGYIIAADHDAARNIKWNNCIITGTRSIFEPADGLHFSGSVPRTVGSSGCTNAQYPLIQDFNITVANCTANDGRSEGARAIGFLFAYVQGAHISNCNASGMSGPQSAGFFVVGGLPGGRSSAITFVNNTAERNGAVGGESSDTRLGTGFFIGRVVDNLVFKNNVANNNGTSPDLDIGAGFLIAANITDPLQIVNNIDFDNCIANGNGNGSINSGGFVVTNFAEEPELPLIVNIAIEKSVAKFNNGYGILYNGNIVGSSINESEIYQNTLGGINIINNPNPVFVSRNTAYLNNANNYNGVSALNIINASVNDVPLVVGFKNVSIL